MVARKRRRHPPSPVTKNHLSEKLRQSSQTSDFSGRAVDGSLRSEFSAASESYPVRAILAEQSDEYLIDWEDDLITGQNYSPSWQPKHNVSKATIEIWEQTAKSSPSLRQSTKVFVQISQHSSLDRAQYLRYHSSLSARGYISSAPPHEDSGLGESSSPLPPEASEIGRSDWEDTIPAQRFPEFGDADFKIINRLAIFPGVFKLQSYGYSPLSRTSDDQRSSNLVEALHSDPVEDASGVYVAESPEYRNWSQRSRSVPAKGITGSARSSSNRASALAALTRSISDPSSVVYSSQASTSAILEVPESRQALRRSLLRSETVAGSKNQDVYVTEPLSLSESYPQSGQSLTCQTDCLSINQESQTSLRRLENSQSPKFRTFQNRQRRSQSKHFVILEDTIADSQPTQITENQALSQRDPNSQSERHLSSISSKEGTALPSVEASEKSSSLVFAATANLPSTLDSRPPPKAPSLSTMSQTPKTQMSVSPRDSPEAGRPSLKERLQAMRKNSRAEAAARKTSGKELGQSPSATAVNDLTVQTNQAILIPERRAPPVTQSLDQAPTYEPNAISSPPVGDKPTGSISITASATQDDAAPRTSAPTTQIEARIETRPLEVPAEIPLPVRVSQPDSHTPTHPSKLSFHEEMASISQVTTSLYPIDLGNMEFLIPLAMGARVRDQYLAVLNDHSSVIHAFERSIPEEIQESTLDQIHEMIARLNYVSTHTDLDDPTTANAKDTSIENLAAWAAYNSEKFKFLGFLIERTRKDQMHIAIIAKSGRLLDIVEGFLKGVRVAYYRPDTYMRTESGTTKGRNEVSLIASGRDGASVLPKAADLIVALDDTFSAQDSQVVTLRSHLTNVGQLAPVVHLLVYKSAEHIERCISRQIDATDRARRIVSCLTQVGDQVGQFQPDQLSPSAAAEEVAAILKEGGFEHHWDSFPRIGPIEKIVSMEYSHNPDAVAEEEANAAAERRVIASSGALKRALVVDDIDQSSAAEKRQRMTPAADISHVSDSITQNSQSTVSSLTAALHDARTEITSLKAANAEREAALQSTLSRTQKQLQQYEIALSEVQERYEDRRQTLSTLRGEKAALEAAATISERKRETQINQIASLKETCKTLEQELQVVRAALLASPTTVIAELETANGEVRKHQADKVALEKKLKYAQGDLEVARTAYQDASNAAVESARQLTELENENKTLRVKASASAADLASITQRNENAVIRNRLVGLEATLKDREEMLRRKEVELLELRRGRGMGTRGSSVKPGGSPRGSRGVSPVAGEPMLRVGSKGSSTLRYGL